MLVKEVLVKYHAKVPFPWTPRKIKKAGFEPAYFLVEVGTEIQKCTDAGSDTAKEIMALIAELDLMG